MIAGTDGQNALRLGPRWESRTSDMVVTESAAGLPEAKHAARGVGDRSCENPFSHPIPRESFPANSRRPANLRIGYLENRARGGITQSSTVPLCPLPRMPAPGGSRFAYREPQGAGGTGAWERGNGSTLSAFPRSRLCYPRTLRHPRRPPAPLVKFRRFGYQIP
jgi:hypothetical protein